MKNWQNNMLNQVSIFGTAACLYGKYQPFFIIMKNLCQIFIRGFVQFKKALVQILIQRL